MTWGFPRESMMLAIDRTLHLMGVLDPDADIQPQWY